MAMNEAQIWPNKVDNWILNKINVSDRETDIK